MAHWYDIVAGVQDYPKSNFCQIHFLAFLLLMGHEVSLVSISHPVLTFLKRNLKTKEISYVLSMFSTGEQHYSMSTIWKCKRSYVQDIG